MRKAKQTADENFSDAWQKHRPYLVDLAFGMLGDVGAAEDVVQEAFVRLAKADLDLIQDHRGWLIVVTSRICLDMIGSAPARHEQVHESSVFDIAGPPATKAPPVDPADRVTLDDEVRLALLVVLQRLKPAERVVFLLHDVFQMPFDAISQTVGRPAPTCRQLARRARMKITSEGGWSSGGVELAEQRLVTERFIQACSSGDLSALLQILDPSVWGDADLGPLGPGGTQVARGRTRVAKNLLRYFGSSQTLVSNPIGNRAVVLAFVDHGLQAVISLSIETGLIKKIHVIADPEKIGFLSSQLPVA